MDKQTAKNKLRELRDSLSQILDGKEYQSSEDIKKQSKEAIAQARSASKQLKKSFIEKIKDLPVLQKVSELGTAGSVAVSTAAVAQTSVAVDQTEVFVASVANDVVEQRVEIPKFLDIVVDFHVLNDWGQVVMAEKVEAAQEFVEVAEAKIEVSEQPSSQSDSPASEGTTPSSEVSSDSTSDDTPSEQQKTETDQTSEETESKTEEKTESSEESSTEEQSEESESSTEESESQQESSEQQSEEVEQNQKSTEASTESNQEAEVVKVMTESIVEIDDVKPHQLISPTQ